VPSTRTNGTFLHAKSQSVSESSGWWSGYALIFAAVNKNASILIGARPGKSEIVVESLLAVCHP